MTSVNYPTWYSYVYPNLVATAGPTYTYSADTMGRPTGLTDQSNNVVVSGVVYGGACAPSNQMSSITYFGYTESRCYNTLGQLTNLNTLAYNYPTGTNNGKISSQYESTSGETVTYTYDSLNRLLSANGSGWTETYGYDAFGSLVSKMPTGSAPQLSIGVNPANNEVVGHPYDANGNDTYGSVYYDAENRVVSAPGVQYAYDSQNKRVWKATYDGSGNLTSQEAYFYGVGGQKLGTYSLVISYGTGQPLYLSDSNTNLDVFFGGRRLAGQDRLGSVGKYYPYGEARSGTSTDNWSFATYWRDSATNLDYADQRYYSNQFARFMTPDPYKAGTGSGDPTNPQSWNHYAYVLSDPVNFKDPRGMDTEAAEGEEGPPDPGWAPLLPGPQNPGKSSDNPKYSYPECDKGSTTEDKNLDFIVNHYDDASAIAAKYSVPADWVLGWAAEESGYGYKPPQAELQNNFYNETLPPRGVTGGWAGAVACVGKTSPGYACFDSFSNSANAAFNKVGSYINNYRADNPNSTMAEIFQAMNNAFHFDTGSDKSEYGQKIQDTTQGGAGFRNSLDQRIDCLKKNKYL
jgi:RHS repeat-associated protein